MQIVNIVVTGSLGQTVSFQKLECLGNKYSLNPSRPYVCLIVLNTANVMVYKSGKYVILGIKKISDVDKVWNELKDILGSILDISLFEKPIIQNIVGIEHFHHQINLNKILSTFRDENIEYEPEQFAGLIWRFDKGISIMFGTGRITFAGFKNMTDMNNKFLYVKEKIESLSHES